MNTEFRIWNACHVYPMKFFLFHRGEMRCLHVKFKAQKYFTREGVYFTVDDIKKNINTFVKSTIFMNGHK